MYKVMVVDNDRDMCSVISDILTEEVYKVAVVHDGRSAVDKVKGQRYDLMILDYRLSGMSGLTVLEEARRIRPTLKVIMISAFGSESVRSRARELGAYSFLDKPFAIKELAKVVRKALRG
ncbi:MAG: response regulator [Deltaproteobacteria bacterium]|nr:response regulator [Deltaproteobacteria bacterium]